MENDYHCNECDVDISTYDGPHVCFADDRKSWDHYFLDMAYQTSLRSPDPSTKVGAVIVSPDNLIVSVGYNGFPRGVRNTVARWTTRPDKYDYVVHAEQNAIFNAAREGRSTKDCKMYLIYKNSLCEHCSRAVIQAGITELIAGSDPFPGIGDGEFYDTQAAAVVMLKEAKVLINIEKDWSIPNG